jgi:endonuclease-3
LGGKDPSLGIRLIFLLERKSDQVRSSVGLGIFGLTNSIPNLGPMHKFTQFVRHLRSHYGEPESPPAKGPFELVLWENAVYLLPDTRRREVISALRGQVGLTATAIDAAPDAVLLPIAIRGGMRPEMRVFRWRQIAQITLDQFAGNLDSILEWPYAEARKALKQFPTIGDPGAEKILLLCGVAAGLPLDSNGLRVLTRAGWGRMQKNYGATYMSVQHDLKPELPVHVEKLKEAHLLLRVHGKTLCKEKMPLCHQCPVAKECRYAQSMTASSVDRAL